MNRMKFGIVFNTESAYWYEKDVEFRKIVDSCDFLTCDGAALAMAAKLKGVLLPRYHGPDLMADILNSQQYKRVFLLGGPPEAHEKIMRDFALEGRQILGDADYYSKLLPDTTLRRIREWRPDVIFVCLGLRKQERIAAQLANSIGEIGGIVLGVGASVDFLGGTKERSSKFFQVIGLEWLPRLIREPRMFARNLRSLRSLPMVLRGKVQITKKGNFIANLQDLTKFL